MKKRSLGGLIMAVALASASGADGESLGIEGGKFGPCPDSPNCVSTQNGSKGHTMKPLPYLKTRELSREKILSILKGMKRTKIIKITESYIHAECRTALWRFTDDVEFFLDDTARVVHFRSASRVGYYDFGLNRKRMKRISEKYLESVEN